MMGEDRSVRAGGRADGRSETWRVGLGVTLDQPDSMQDAERLRPGPER